jgi:hypothetical protein
MLLQGFKNLVGLMNNTCKDLKRPCRNDNISQNKKIEKIEKLNKP